MSAACTEAVAPARDRTTTTFRTEASPTITVESPPDDERCSRRHEPFNDDDIIPRPCVGKVRPIPWQEGRIKRGDDAKLVLLVDRDSTRCIGLVSVAIGYRGKRQMLVLLKGGRLKDPKDCELGEMPARVVEPLRPKTVPPRGWDLVDGSAG
jgi:hypothetical protein